MEEINLEQKIYEISGVPKSYLEEIEEKQLTRDEARLERRFEKFVEHLIKNKKQ